MKYVPHMVTFFESIEAAISMAGWRKGVEALVASWVEYRRVRLQWEETWEPDGRHRLFSKSSSGIRYVIERVARDKWSFGVSWPDEWGYEHIRTGSLEDLQGEANKLAQVGGPFGGPITSPRSVCATSSGRVWRVADEVELRFEVLRENLGVHFHITRSGTINNHRVFNFDHSKLQTQVDSLKAIEPSELRQGVLVGGKRRPWSYTAMRPLLAYMEFGERELLLVCPTPPTVVILAHTKGHLEVAAMLDPVYLSDFDITWLDEARRWPDRKGAWGYVDIIPGSAPLRMYIGPPVSPPYKAEGLSRPGRDNATPSTTEMSCNGSPQPPASSPSTTTAGTVPSSARPTAPQSPPRAVEAVPHPSFPGGAGPPPQTSSLPTTTAEATSSSRSTAPTSPPRGAEAAPRPGPPGSADSTPPPVTLSPPSAPPTRVAPTSAETPPPSPPPASPNGETGLAVAPSESRPPSPSNGEPAPTTPPLTDTPESRTPTVSPPAAPEPTLAEETPTGTSTSTPTPATAPQESTSGELLGVESSEISPPVGSPPTPPSPSSAPDVPSEPEQPKPRFPLAENPSPAEIERHFAEVEAAIPPKLTGAATAVELWQGLDQAHRHGALPITGGWIDLVSTLHRRGWLSRLPGDRATRAAFLILESLSPLVRRLHRRRWVLGLER